MQFSIITILIQTKLLFIYCNMKRLNGNNIPLVTICLCLATILMYTSSKFRFSTNKLKTYYVRQQEDSEKSTKNLKEHGNDAVLRFDDNNFTMADLSSQFIDGIPKNLLKTLTRMYTEVMAWNKTGVEIISYKRQRHSCKAGFYKLSHMTECRRMFSCDDVDERVTYGKHLATGTAKKVFLGKVDGEMVVISQTNDEKTHKPLVMARTKDGIENLIRLQHQPYVIQLVGFCMDRNNILMMATEECSKYTSLRSMIFTTNLYDLSPRTRFRMATQLVASIDFLHRVGKHPMVHCDLHSRQQSLGQFLVTNDGQIVLNDLDEIPEVIEGRKITCRPESAGVMRDPDFLAPEGRFTYEEFLNKTHWKPVTEKSDIWKIPFMTNILLIPKRKLNKEEVEIQKHLKRIHAECGNIEPNNRPNSLQVLNAYLNAYQQMFD